MSGRRHVHDEDRSDHLQQLVDDGDLEAVLTEVSLTDIAEAWACYQRRRSRTTFDADWWAVELWIDCPFDKTTRREGLLALIDCVDEDLLGHVGAGPLEDFISDDESDVRWIETQAVANERLRRALLNVYAWSRVDDRTLARLDQAAGAPLPRPGASHARQPDGTHDDGT